MELGLRGKRALVTGASRGLGLAIARGLAAEGCNLILSARDAERLSAVADAIRRDYDVSVATVAGDLSQTRRSGQAGRFRRRAGHRGEQRRRKILLEKSTRLPKKSGGRPGT